MKLVRFVAAAFVMSFALPAHAEWQKTESYEYSAKTSLRIVDPAHAKVFVTLGNETKEESLPAIFNLPDHDAYVPVKIVSADGETWTGKVEVKAHKQTVVHFAHKAAAKAPEAPAAPAHKLIGRLENATNTCRVADRVDKYVIMKDGKVVLETALEPNRAQHNVELEAGTYTVRIFRAGIFVKSLELAVQKDGWVFRYGC